MKHLLRCLDWLFVGALVTLNGWAVAHAPPRMELGRFILLIVGVAVTLTQLKRLFKAGPVETRDDFLMRERA